MKKRKLSPVQRAWCKLYEDETGFDVHTIGDYEAGNMSFYEAATKAAQWYEDHSNDAHLRITAKIPGEWKALRERI